MGIDLTDPAAVDAAYGLEPGHPFGRIDYCYGAILESRIAPEDHGHQWWDEVATQGGTPWRTDSGEQDDAKARVEVLLSRVYPVDRVAWGWQVEIEQSLGAVSQEAVARREGITQPTVCYRIAMARDRMAVAAHLPDYEVGELRDAIVEACSKSDRRPWATPAELLGTVCEAYYWAPNQQGIGVVLGMSQGRVRQMLGSAERLLGPDHPLSILHARWRYTPSVAFSPRHAGHGKQTPALYRGDGERRVRELLGIVGPVRGVGSPSSTT